MTPNRTEGADFTNVFWIKQGMASAKPKRTVTEHEECRMNANVANNATCCSTRYIQGRIYAKKKVILPRVLCYAYLHTHYECDGKTLLKGDKYK